MTNSGEHRPPARPGVIARLVTLPFQLFGMLCGSLLLSILIECIGIHFFWPEERWRHAEGMLEHELDQLSAYFRQSLLMDEPGQTTKALVDRVYDKVFVETGMFDWIMATSSPADTAAHETAGLKYLLNQAYSHVESYALAAGYTALTFLVRLIILCLTLPLFLMAVFVGLVDGIARRDIRRFGAGRESSFIFHRAKASIAPFSILPWVIYLAMPISVHPLLILMPSAILIGIAVNITSATFKKYL